jgi:hypothetical protein
LQGLGLVVERHWSWERTTDPTSLHEPWTVEEMAVNGLRETFHHWVRTLAMPVTNGNLGEQLVYAGPHHAEHPAAAASRRLQDARDLWDEVDEHVRVLIGNFRKTLTERIKHELKQAYDEASAREKEAFERRIYEVAALQRTQSIEKLRREIDERRNASRQLDLWEDADAKADRELRDLEDELKRRQGQFGDLHYLL